MKAKGRNKSRKEAQGKEWKNLDKIVAQAREWAILARTLSEADPAKVYNLDGLRERMALDDMNSADLGSAEGIRTAARNAKTLCLEAEWAYTIAGGIRATDREKKKRYDCAIGIYRALAGLWRCQLAAEGRPEWRPDKRFGDGVRQGFIECAMGLSVALSAWDDAIAATIVAQGAAQLGAQELFDALTREEES